MTKQLIFASRNAGKIKEIRSLLKPLGVEVLSAIEADLPEVEETGETFAENASLKASSAALSAGLPALADDSGLCIHALKNAPGVQTARYAQKCGGYEAAFADIFKKLEGKSDWTAHFSCVIALAFPNGTIKTYEGKCEGRIVQPKGIDGFGFDYQDVKFLVRPKRKETGVLDLADETTYSNVTAGELAYQMFKYLLTNGKLSQANINLLMTKDYTRETFKKIVYPVLALSREANRGDSKIFRYYKAPVNVNGVDIYISSQWFEESRNDLIRYFQGKA